MQRFSLEIHVEDEFFWKFHREELMKYLVVQKETQKKKKTDL